MRRKNRKGGKKETQEEVTNKRERGREKERGSAEIKLVAQK